MCVHVRQGNEIRGEDDGAVSSDGDFQMGVERLWWRVNRDVSKQSEYGWIWDQKQFSFNFSINHLKASFRDDFILDVTWKEWTPKDLFCKKKIVQKSFEIQIWRQT